MPTPFEQLRDEFEADAERAMVKAEVAAGLFGAAPIRICNGRFELIRRRGRGALGIVYEALDRDRGTRVAVKLLSRLDARAISQLKREFRSLSELVHPNLVRLDALFNQQAQWFFSMELVEGQSFEQFVRTPGTDAVAPLAQLLAQLTAAVSAIHAAGKLHRDLKPSNVLVTDTGRVVVLDFGLVFDEPFGPEAMRTQSEIVGTPAYMAPELALGRAPTRASDWYAVGVMLFEVLTGQLPFEGGMLQMFTDKQQREAPDPQALAPDAPAELCALCRRLLLRDAQARAGAGELRQVLSALAPEVDAGADARRAPAQGVFVGRDRELAMLTRALAEASAGTPVWLLLHGPSGVGKSALLERFAQQTEGQAQLLRGRCYPQESVPYKVFDDVMDALGAHLRRLRPEHARGLLPRHLPALLQLFPALGEVRSIADALATHVRLEDPRELRKQGFAALKELLLRLTDQGPLVVLVDDLQWGDIDSAHMLASVLSPPNAPPLLFVGAYRSDEVESSAFLRAVLGQEGELRWQPRRSPLDPLPLEVGSELARELLGPEAAAALSVAVATEAAGVPFFITELAGQLRSEGERSAALPSGVTVDQLILARIAELPASSQRLLRVLSIASRPLEIAVASQAAQLGREDQGTLLALRAARLLRLRQTATGELAEPYHDRIREAIATSLSEAERRTTHQALAEALQQHAVADPDRLVLHYRGAGDRVRAGETAIQAGLAANRKLAFNHAVQLLQRAVELMPLPGRPAHELYRHLGDALSNAGHAAAAGDAYLRAADDAPNDAGLRLRALAAVQFINSLRAEQGLGLARETLRSVGVEMPQGMWALTRMYYAERLRLYARRARLVRPQPAPDMLLRLSVMRDLAHAVGWIDVAGAAILHMQYRRDALDAGEPDHVLNALAGEAMVHGTAGGSTFTRRYQRTIADLRAVAQRTGTRYAQALVHMAEANHVLWTARDYGHSLRLADQAEMLLAEESAPLPWQRIQIALVQLLALSFHGGLDRLLRMARAFELDALERDGQVLPMMITLTGSLCDLIRDRPKAAIATLERLRDAASVSLNFRHTFCLRIAEALSYAGRAEEAHEVTEQHFQELRGSLLHYSEYVRHNFSYYRARAALDAYFRGGSAALLAFARRITAELPDEASSHGAHRDALLASIALAQGDRGVATMRMSSAVQRFRGCQADLLALHAERCLHEITGDGAELERVDGALKAEGVVNPARYVGTFIPLG